MKALSLTQPWATLVVTGRKRLETRSWAPPPFVLGHRIAIHASKSMPGWARDAAIEFGLRPDELPLGAIVGSVILTGWQHVEKVDVDEEERRYGDYSPGRYAWSLEKPHRLEEPIPATGRLGFWSWTPSWSPARREVVPTSVGGTDG